MKRLRLWVKVVLLVLVSILVILSIRFLNNWNKNIVKGCVEGGNTYNWCMKELSK